MTIKKCVLSNGLCILNVKKKTNDLVLLSLTDFNNTGKFIYDTVENKVVGAGTDLKLNSADLNLIQGFIKTSQASVKEDLTPVVKS